MSSISAFMRGEPTSAASRRSTADASTCFSGTGFATHLGPRSSRLKEPERRRHGTSAFFRAASTGFQESREATSTSLRDSDLFPLYPALRLRLRVGLNYFAPTALD